MHRLVVFGQGCLVATCLLAVGCASGPAASSKLAYQPAAASAVDTGPPDCRAVAARIHGSEARDAVQAGTWLDAPHRMAESRRMRALTARADALGCTLPQI